MNGKTKNGYISTYNREGRNSGGSIRTNRQANDVLSILSCHVETVVSLVRKTPDDYIHVKLDLDDLDLTASESKATYSKIKAYVLEKFGLKVSSLYIAQIKEKYGIIERENYNLPKTEGNRVPKCPKEKEDAITDALQYFKMI